MPAAIRSDWAGGNSRSESTAITSARAVTDASAAVDTAAVAAEVVRDHRARQHHVGVGVEPAAQLVAVVVQVRLHREPPALQRLLAALRDAPEPLVQLRGAAVGLVRDLPGQAEADVRAVAVGGVVVVAVAVARVGADRGQLRVEPGDLVAGRLRGGRDRGDGLDALRGARRPLQHAQAAQRRADDERPRVDAEQVGQADLGGDLVAHGQQGEPAAPRPPVGPG